MAFRPALLTGSAERPGPDEFAGCVCLTGFAGRLFRISLQDESSGYVCRTGFLGRFFRTDFFGKISRTALPDGFPGQLCRTASGFDRGCPRPLLSGPAPDADRFRPNSSGRTVPAGPAGSDCIPTAPTRFRQVSADFADLPPLRPVPPVPASGPIPARFWSGSAPIPTGPARSP